MEPTLRKRYEIAQHINDSRRLFRIWDNSQCKFIDDGSKPDSILNVTKKCNRMNDEEDLYMNALSDYYNETIK